MTIAAIHTVWHKQSNALTYNRADKVISNFVIANKKMRPVCSLCLQVTGNEVKRVKAMFMVTIIKSLNLAVGALFCI